MLEIYRIDGITLYLPISRIYMISKSGNGELDISVDDGKSEKTWHKAYGFTVVREGQPIEA